MMNNLGMVKGVGRKTVVLFEKIGISSINDLVTHYPFRYELLAKTDLNNVNDNDRVVVEGIIENEPIIIRFKGKMNKMTFRVNVNTVVVNIVIYNRAFLKSQLKIGNSIVIIGKYDRIKNIIIASDIKFTLLGNSVKIEPIYHTTSGLSNKIINNYIMEILNNYQTEINDLLPNYLKEKYNFITRLNALMIVHHPSNIEELKKAQIMLKYEELFLFMFKINYLNMKRKKEDNGLIRNIDISKIESFISSFPFLLTYDQKKVIDEILKDLTGNSRMNRLLQGDVGSGKTIVAMVAMYANFLGGYQTALMAPTEILAVQHYNNIKEIFKNINIKIELLIGSTDKRQKRKIYDDIENGKINIIVGTHALIQGELKYYNLGLVITDEQQRFGVNQRANLQNKGFMPDVLYMSATPIPRTYALTIYGDMDISSIKTMPSGKKEIITYLKTTKELTDVLKIMWSELEKNHQIYVVAPLIEESEKMDLTNINLLKEKMEMAFGKKYSIDILHGKMNSNEKEKIMNQFYNNKINILISTTIIEVGLNVQNATVIVIFDANYFGLATLHQLRGRVGRNNIQSYAILICDHDTERLKIMEKTSDGFLISEADFNFRGHGDLFGIKQSGDMNFKIANLKKDFKILLQAKEDSYNLLNDDFYNNIKSYSQLKNIIEDLNHLN